MGKRKRPRKNKSKSNSIARVTATLNKPSVNTRAAFTVVPIYSPDDPRSQPPPTPQGYPGTYVVTFVLSIPGKDVFRVALKFDELMQSGESLLLVDGGISEFVMQVAYENKKHEIVFSRNTDGMLSTARIRLDAQSMIEAASTAYNALCPLLSHWSFVYDVAIDISGYEVVEEKTQTRTWSFALLGRPKSIDPRTISETDIPRGFHSVLSTYREALNATNIFHQVLCFYKVIKAVRQLSRSRMQKSSNGDRQMPDRIPSTIADVELDDPTQKDYFIPYLGKKFTWLEDHYRDLLRNAITHLNPESDDLSADRYEDITECLKAIPVLKYVARRLLQVEITAQS